MRNAIYGATVLKEIIMAHLVKCPKCGNNVSSEAKNCPKCGGSMAAPPPPPPPPKPKPPQFRIKCQLCKTDVAGDCGSCPSCGHTVTKDLLAKGICPGCGTKNGIPTKNEDYTSKSYGKRDMKNWGLKSQHRGMDDFLFMAVCPKCDYTFYIS